MSYPTIRGSHLGNAYQQYVTCNGGRLFTAIIPSNTESSPVLSRVKGQIIKKQTEGGLVDEQLYNDYIYITNNAGIRCYHASNGTLMWSYDFDFSGTGAAFVELVQDVSPAIVDNFGQVHAVAYGKWTVNYEYYWDLENPVNITLYGIKGFTVDAVTGAEVSTYGPQSASAIIGSGGVLTSGNSGVAPYPTGASDQGVMGLPSLYKVSLPAPTETWLAPFTTRTTSYQDLFSITYNCQYNYGYISPGFNAVNNSGNSGQLALDAGPEITSPYPMSIYTGVTVLHGYVKSDNPGDATPSLIGHYSFDEDEGESFSLKNACFVRGQEQYLDGSVYKTAQRYILSADDEIRIYLGAGGTYVKNIGGNVRKGMGIRQVQVAVQDPAKPPGNMINIPFDLTYYTTTNGKIGCIVVSETEELSREWEVNMPTSSDPSGPLVTDTRVFVGDSLNLYEYDADNGDLLNTFTLPGVITDNMAATSDGYIVITTTGGILTVLTRDVADDPDPSATFEITYVTPENDAVDVAVDSTITVSFNSEPDPAYADASYITLKQGSSIIACDYAVNGLSVDITPTDGLMSSTEYTLYIDEDMQDIDAVSLGDDFQFSFTTGTASFSDETDKFEMPSVIAPIEAKFANSYITSQIPRINNPSADWLLHVKFTTYEDAGGVTEIESKNTSDNPTEFQISNDFGKTWTPTPKAGITQSRAGHYIRAKMNMGLNNTGYLRISLAAEDA